MWLLEAVRVTVSVSTFLLSYQLVGTTDAERLYVLPRTHTQTGTGGLFFFVLGYMLRDACSKAVK